MESGHALCLQGCAHLLHQVREREKEKERESDKQRGSEIVRKREKEGERWRKRERERCRICPELLFLFFKGMTDWCLGTF